MAMITACAPELRRRRDPPMITAILEDLNLFPRKIVSDPPHAPP